MASRIKAYLGVVLEQPYVIGCQRFRWSDKPKEGVLTGRTGTEALAKVNEGFWPELVKAFFRGKLETDGKGTETT